LKNGIDKFVPAEKEDRRTEKEESFVVQKFQLKWNLPNMIVIAGNGRNVGKTTFARSIIRHFSEKADVIAIKTSPHLHKINDDLEVICMTSDFIVAEEKGISRKDSSLLLQAGAKRVYFIMAKQEFLESAFSVISGKLDNQIVIAESGGLHELVAPGIFFFVRNQYGITGKEQYLKYNPHIVTNSDHGFDFEIERLGFSNNHVTIKNKG